MTLLAGFFKDPVFTYPSWGLFNGDNHYTTEAVLISFSKFSILEGKK